MGCQWCKLLLQVSVTTSVTEPCPFTSCPIRKLLRTVDCSWEPWHLPRALLSHCTCLLPAVAAELCFSNYKCQFLEWFTYTIIHVVTSNLWSVYLWCVLNSCTKLIWFQPTNVQSFKPGATHVAAGSITVVACLNIACSIMSPACLCCCCFPWWWWRDGWWLCEL